MLAKETVDAVRQLPTSRSEAEAVRGLLRSTTQEQAQPQREGEQSEDQADGEPEDPQDEAGTETETEAQAVVAEQSGSETVEQEAGDVEASISRSIGEPVRRRRKQASSMGGYSRSRGSR